MYDVHEGCIMQHLCYNQVGALGPIDVRYIIRCMIHQSMYTPPPTHTHTLPVDLGTTVL